MVRGKHRNSGKTPAKQVIEEIGKKLVQEEVLFFISAGLSSNWGYPTAGRWAEEILKRCSSVLTPDVCQEIHDVLQPRPGEDKSSPDLGILAELLECRFGKCPTLGCLLGFGLSDQRAREPWLTRAEARERLLRGVEVIGIPHIVLARLAREKLITEVITTNYDVLLETACWAVGMDDEAERADCGGYTGTPAAFRVIAGGFEYYASRTQQNVFRIYKIHGCAHKLITAFANRHAGNEDCDQCPHLTQGNGAMCSRKDAVKDLNLVLTRRELQHWRRDDWAKDLLCDRARNHNLILVGFSGADQVLNVTLRNLFAEIQAALKETTSGLQSGDERATLSPRRAYAIDIRLGPDLAAILRDASFSQPLPLRPSAQFLPIEENKDKAKTKASMESAFSNMYVTAIHELLLTLMEDRGIGTVRLQAGTLTERQAEAILNNTKDFLYQAEQHCPPFIMDTLPGAVAASWLYGADVAEASSRPAMFVLANRPHFYIPLTYNFSATLGLLRFYSLLPEAANFRPDGWVEMLKATGVSYPAYVLLPLYRPQHENLPWLNQWVKRRYGTITAGRKAVVVLLSDDGGTSSTAGEMEPGETDAAAADYWTVRVPMGVLWNPDTRDIWAFLVPALKRCEEEGGWSYAAASGG